jgi:hypothetical protein
LGENGSDPVLARTFAIVIRSLVHSFLSSVVDGRLEAIVSIPVGGDKPRRSSSLASGRGDRLLPLLR